MHVTLVHVHVNAGNRQAFIDACKTNHEASVQEPGNLRFDVLQSPDDPDYFVLYEAYRSADDAAAHKQTQHYLQWRSTVADWMATPRQGINFNGLFPEHD